MALLVPNSGKISQAFGPTIVAVEYPAYGTKDEGTWSPLGSWPRYDHFHMAEDIQAAEGTPIVASEDGKVIYSGYEGSGGGYKIEVRIAGQPGTSYSSNHCSRLYVGVGATVAKGQKIAAVGHSGIATGNHNHFWVCHEEIHSGELRHVFYRPSLFYAGGALANVAWILPAVAKITTLASYSPQRTAIIPPNKTVYGYDPKRPGRWVARYLATPTGSNFPVDKKVQIAWPNPAVYNPVPNGTFLHATAGVFAGLYVPMTAVTAADGKPW